MNPEEITLAQGRLHWGIFALPLLAVCSLLVIALSSLFLVHTISNMFGQLNPQSSPFARNLLYFMVVLPEILIGLALLLLTWAAYAKSNITLTSRRLIFRTGFVARVAGELPLENVEAIIFVEPLLGRIMGFGTVVVTSLGGFRFPLRYLASAQDFHALLQKAVADTKSPGKRPLPPAPDDDSRFMPR